MLADKLKELRNKNNLTQIQFSKAFGISSGTIAMWETGKRSPDIDTICSLATFFNVSVDYLLDRTPEHENMLTRVPEDIKKYLEKLIFALNDLNEEGREKLVDLADDLVKTGKYKKSAPNELGQKKAQ